MTHAVTHMMTDTTVHLNQLAVTEEVEISIDNADDGDNVNEVTAEESSGNHAMNRGGIRSERSY